MSALLRSLVISAPLLLAACSGGSSPTATATPTPTPTPSATFGPPPTFAYNVEPCFTQVIPDTGGQTLRNLLVPDTLKLDLSRPSLYPNGRKLEDQVIDITLTWLFLDLSVTGQSTRTFANLPLNPPGNDRPFNASFPFLAPPQGTPPLAATTGTSFDFRTDPDSAFVQVDRFAMPGVSTVLIGAPLKNPYNDGSPSVDVTGQYRAEQTAQMVSLMNSIGDDLTMIGLKICATRS
ncbi:MAG: hypothetical protein ABIT16_05875 [Croceibacterium sp.]